MSSNTTDTAKIATTTHNDSILSQLERIRFTLSYSATTTSTCSPLLPLEVDLFALSGEAFNQLTNSSSSGKTQDGTGMRPYSGALAFLQFVRAFPLVFSSAENSSDCCSTVELGAGIGACGLLIAKLQKESLLLSSNNTDEASTATDETRIRNDKRLPRILITDGEDLAVETSKRNRTELGLETSDAEICKLLWSDDPKELAKQITNGLSNKNSKSATEDTCLLPRFTHVVGTDLLYYLSDARVLVATAAALLAGSSSGGGAIFLPAIIRCSTSADELMKAAGNHDLDVSTISMRKFIAPADLELVGGWYNIDFLILTRKGATLQPALQKAMLECNQKAFDPDDSSSGDEDDN